MRDSNETVVNNKRPAGSSTCGPSGGLFGIDQEVVTLTWPLRQLPGLSMEVLARPTPERIQTHR